MGLVKGLWEKAKDTAFGATEAAKEHTRAATEAKKLLDEGGRRAEEAILAKKLSATAVAIDHETVHLAQRCIEPFSEAAAQLRKVAHAPRVKGIEGYESFEKLASEYEARAGIYRQVVKLLGATAPRAPALTAVEEEALSLVRMRETYEWVRDTVAQLALARRRADDTSAVGPAGGKRDTE